jgi:hypothetical protein
MNKKTFVAGLAVGCIGLSAVAHAAPRGIPIDEGTSPTVTVIINSLTLRASPAPYIVEGRTMVPMRAILEALGATVTWDERTQTATASNGTHRLQVTIGSRDAIIDGNKVKMDVPAQIIEDRTFLPLRFTAAALGAAVDWDRTTYTATIAQPGTEGYSPMLEAKLDRTLDENLRVAKSKQLDLVQQCGRDPEQLPETCPQKAANQFFRWIVANYDDGKLFDMKAQLDWMNLAPFMWHGHELTPRDAGNVNYGYVLSNLFSEEIVWGGAGLQQMWSLRRKGLNPITYCSAGYYCESPDTARGIMLGIEYYHERAGS